MQMHLVLLDNYLFTTNHGLLITSAEQVMFSQRSVCLSVCDFWRVGRGPRNNRLNFGDDPDPFLYFAPTFHPHNASSVQ